MIDKTQEVREAVSALLAETFRSGVFNSGELADEIARAALSVIQKDMVIVPREALEPFERATYREAYIMAHDVHTPPPEAEIEMAWNIYCTMNARRDAKAMLSVVE